MPEPEPTLRERAAEVLARPSTVTRVAAATPLVLLALGLVMVLSASSVTAYAESGSSYSELRKQLVFAGLGLAGALVLALLPVVWIRRLALPALAVTIVLQALVFSPLGIDYKGNRNWILLGSQTLQPSELLKLGLVLGGAHLLAHKIKRLGEALHLIVPFIVPVALVALGLVLGGRDLGSGLVITAIVIGMLWVAGASLWWFVAALGAAGVMATVLALTSANRMGRIAVWLNGCAGPQEEACYQKVHGEYALADGGWWGVGLGASREKWFYLPEPHNDFIYAVIGEELGMVGATFVLLAFLVIGWVGYRVIAGTRDPFVRIATAGIMAWLLGQALINIGSVIGLLPIIGVPLPFVSSGGSALVAALGAAGVLLAFAREQSRPPRRGRGGRARAGSTGGRSARRAPAPRARPSRVGE
ncbi:cell division-specific peptidoglycan biosynthesis regulator FtsW [Kytococcus aerolatus]|uniref:Probable peptidoglycan glycosyltransferase FtsW n=1 Tax=Kytococcus aerolatus TaxID=592308 RepID=A0A212T527_9MICO|nr:putative lipid II flippase FtsW [Kytococcus aerolatus]SNC60936.1 cell division-specific peptidoglycan biosynthesis regulator FtsW [Kytococcus aerolatus]